MSNAKLLIAGIFIILLLTGCNNGETQNSVNENVSPTKVSDPGSVAIQASANKARDIINKRKEVKEVQAVDLNRDLLIAIEFKHQYKFQSQDLVKEIKKKLDKELPGKEITVTTDHKIFIELEKLNGKVLKEEIKKTELKKEIDHLKQLLAEQK